MIGKRLRAHVHPGSDLVGGVLFLPPDALALDEVYGVNELDGAAQILGGVGDIAPRRSRRTGRSGQSPAVAGSSLCRKR